MGRVRKALYIILGSICVILGLIGIFLPVLPTTPFLLLAAFFFTRSSEQALHWLLNNRWFGSYIRNYHEGRGMTLQNKVITLLSLWITITAGVIFMENPWLRITLFLIASGVTIHLLRVRTYRSGGQPDA